MEITFERLNESESLVSVFGSIVVDTEERRVFIAMLEELIDRYKL